MYQFCTTHKQLKCQQIKWLFFPRSCFNPMAISFENLFTLKSCMVIINNFNLLAIKCVAKTVLLSYLVILLLSLLNRLS